MLGRRERDDSPTARRLPYKRRDDDVQFWARIAALWHRERMREVYESTGLPSHEARSRANNEALDVALRHGWRGNLAQLKASLGELVVHDLPSRGRLNGHGIRFWEEQVQADMMLLLTLDAEELSRELLSYLRQEVRSGGRFAGRRGFYRLSHVINFVPSFDHTELRQAFVKTVTRIGHDPGCCDRELYKVVMRLLRDYSRRPFETRLGVPMPEPSTRRRTNGTRRRRLFGFIPLG